MAQHLHYSDVLVGRDEIADLVKNGTRLIQVDLDPQAYDHGHLASAYPWSWETQLRNKETQEILTQAEFEGLLGSSGISPTTPVVLYGDNNNWFACWAFWLLKMYGHHNVRILDGGLTAWIKNGLPLSETRPSYEPVSYQAQKASQQDKAATEDIFAAFFNPKSHCLVDVRSAAEYEGRLTSPGVGTSSRCEVAGHIPTAINIPWNLNCNADGTFKSPDDLRSMYESFGVSQDKTVITYCAIGERSSLSWFVLRHLLKYDVVMNYDRSMAQWSRITNAPIEVSRAA